MCMSVHLCTATDGPEWTKGILKTIQTDAQTHKCIHTNAETHLDAEEGSKANPQR